LSNELKILIIIINMPNPNAMIQLTSTFNNLNIERLNVQPKCKFLLRCMRSIRKDKNNQFKYTKLVNFMTKNKDNDLYYKGSGITSTKNLKSYWNYAHSHKTAYIPNFSKMYNIVQPKVKRGPQSRIGNNYKPRTTITTTTTTTVTSST